MTHNVPRAPGDVAGSFVLRLAVALQEAGARVEVIAPGAPGLADADVIDDVRIQRVRYADERRMTLAYTGTMAEAVQGSWSGRAALVQLLWHLRRATARTIARAARDSDPFTHLHAHWWFPSALAVWGLPGKCRVPLVITMHGSDVRLAEKVRPAHPLMRRVLGEAQVCTAVSSWLADAAHRIAPASDVIVAPMPIDDRLFLRAPDPGPREGVLFVGRLNAQKGLADVLHALADPRLARTSLTVVGDGPDGDALRQQADALGVSDRVTWCGMLPPDHLPALYRQAAVLAMPSRHEGLGLVAVEAQLCGTPVVAYAEGGVLDVVRPEHGGTLVTAGDRQAFADALARRLEDEDGWHTDGLAARAFVASRFAPTAVAQRYLELYRSCTA